MAKIVVPKKLVVDINEDGTFSKATMLYKLKENGSENPKGLSMTVSDAIVDTEGFNIELANMKSHIEQGEGLQ